MSTAVRYTPQKKQELRSRHQLADRLTDFGWVPVVPEDLGEDFIVHIYHEGQATGVNFFTQLKSVTNLYERRKGDHLPYSFEVKDLFHWDKFTLPVVLIIWDIKLREGRWVLIDDAIKYLDQDYPNWRKQKTKTIFFPWENKTDEQGLIKLRKAIGKKIFPLIPSEKIQDTQVELTFNIKTEEDKKNWGKLNHHLDFGDEVTLKNINAHFHFPELSKLWLDTPRSGNYDITFSEKKSDKEFTTDISFGDRAGKIFFFDSTKFKAVKIGKAAITISNKHQLNAPIHFEFIFEYPNESEQKPAKTRASLKRNNYGSNTLQTQKILYFMKALAKGGDLILTLRELDDKSLVLTSPPVPEIAPKLEFVSLVDKLCLIQSSTKNLFKVPNEGFRPKDVEAIEQAFSMIQKGKFICSNQSYTAEFLNQAIVLGGLKENFLNILLQFREKNLPIQFTFTFTDSEIKILGKKIKTGLKVQHLVCNISTSVPILRNAIKTLRSDESLEVHFDGVEEVSVFPNWFKKEANRISQLLANRFNVNRIYLFGSLVWGQTFSPETDIDLAVVGLSSEQLFKAIGYLEGETNFSFDLVDLDAAPKSLQERISKEGKLLYERELVAIS